MSDSANPFAAPDHDDPAPGSGAFGTHGRNLLVPPDAEWPGWCLDCGEPAEVRVPVRLGHRPGMPGGTVAAPYCRRHARGRRRLRLVTAWILPLPLVVGAAALFAPLRSDAYRVVGLLAGALGFLYLSATYLRHQRHDLTVVAQRLGCREVAGISRAYLARIQRDEA